MAVVTLHHIQYITNISKNVSIKQHFPVYKYLYGSRTEHFCVTFLSITASTDSFMGIAYHMLKNKDVHVHNMQKSDVL